MVQLEGYIPSLFCHFDIMVGSAMRVGLGEVIIGSYYWKLLLVELK